MSTDRQPEEDNRPPEDNLAAAIRHKVARCGYPEQNLTMALLAFQIWDPTSGTVRSVVTTPIGATSLLDQLDALHVALEDTEAGLDATLGQAG